MNTRTQRIAHWCTELLTIIDRRPPGYEASPPSVHDLHHAANGLLAGVAMYAVWKDGEQLVGVMRQPLHEVRGELREAEDTVRERLLTDARLRHIAGDTPWTRRQAS